MQKVRNGLAGVMVLAAIMMIPAGGPAAKAGIALILTALILQKG